MPFNRSPHWPQGLPHHLTIPETNLYLGRLDGRQDTLQLGAEFEGFEGLKVSCGEVGRPTDIVQP